MIKYLKNLEEGEANRLKQNILEWSNAQDEYCTLFENITIQSRDENQFIWKLGVICQSEYLYDSLDFPLTKFEEYIQTKENEKFCFISYDLKNNFENLTSRNEDKVDFPLILAWEPQLIFIYNTQGSLEIHYTNEKSHQQAEAILNWDKKTNKVKEDGEIVNKISKGEYENAFNKIANYIKVGDLFELNFCKEYFIKDIKLDSLALYEIMKSRTQANFCVYAQLKSHKIICVSPERFITKKGNSILSQPIKGTKKSSSNQKENQIFIKQLRESQKDRAENTMAVDVVRNDFSKICVPGSVHVPNFCDVVDYGNVIQMFSTVVGELKTNTSFIEILRAVFPMASMTGAPKIRAMEIIEELESSKRGLYSGTIGYILPNGDFDFNVVIRSIIYERKNRYLSFHTGGAITVQSQMEEEYTETELKASSLILSIQDLIYGK